MTVVFGEVNDRGNARKLAILIAYYIGFQSLLINEFQTINFKQVQLINPPPPTTTSIDNFKN